MTWDDYLQALGPDVMAEIRRRVAEAPPATPGLVAELRTVLAPPMQRLRTSRAAEHLAATNRDAA